VVLEAIDDAQALLVVVEAARHERVDHALAGVTERRVAEVVAERDRLGQLLVQPQHLGDRARDLRDLERMRQARAVVIAGRREEDLRLVLETAERLAVDDAVAVALKRRPHVVLGFGAQPRAGVGALGGLRREDVTLPLLELMTQGRHGSGPIGPTSSPAGSWRRSPAAPRRTGRRASDRDRRTSRGSRGPRRRA